TPAAAIWSSLPTVARAILDPPSWNSRLGTHQGVSDTRQTYVRRACAVKAEPQDVGLEEGRAPPPAPRAKMLGEVLDDPRRHRSDPCDPGHGRRRDRAPDPAGGGPV